MRAASARAWPAKVTYARTMPRPAARRLTHSGKHPAHRPPAPPPAAAGWGGAPPPPACAACSAARAPAWSTRPISATSRARSSRVSTRWMMGVIMAPSQRKPDAPAHPPVPQRIAPGAPATRCDNLLHKYAFRLVRQVTSPETTLSDIPSSNRETTVQAAHAPRFAAPCRRHARESGARPLPTATPVSWAAPPAAADQRRRHARRAATRHRRARRRSSVARGAAHHRVSRMAAQRGRTAQAPHGGEGRVRRSEEHTSELQSPCNLVCRLLLEKKKNKKRKSDE